MKNLFRLLLTTALFTGVFAACNPTTEAPVPPEEPKELKLYANSMTVAANGTDAVTFSVKYDGKTISNATITYGAETLDGNSFSTTEAGEYKFTATYEEQTSNEITITASEVHTLELFADVEEIYADNIEEVTFTVEFDGEEVVDATVSVVGEEPLDGTVFTTTEAGTYKFYATYNFEGTTHESEEVTVVAKKIPTLTIIVDRIFLKNNGSDVANFTVMLGEDDVTADAEILKDDSPFTGTTFSDTTLGEYQFSATYIHSVWGEMSAEPVTVSVVDVQYDAARSITKNVAFFTWTATWCGPCYVYKGYLKKMADEYGSTMLQVNIHSESGDAIGSLSSVIATKSQLAQEGRFRVGGVPTSIADLREDFATPGYVPSEAQARAAYNKYIGNSPTSAIMVDSEIADGKINVEITVGVREENKYAIGIFLVEDHIVAYQNGGGNYYDHTNVARDMGVSNLYGDSMGTLSAGGVYIKNCSFDLLSKYNADNLSLIVYTLYNDNGHMNVDSVIKVPANGKTEFNYAN